MKTDFEIADFLRTTRCLSPIVTISPAMADRIADLLDGGPPGRSCGWVDCGQTALTGGAFCGTHEPKGTSARYRQAVDQLRAMAEWHPEQPIQTETVLVCIRSLIGDPEVTT